MVIELDVSPMLWKKMSKAAFIQSKKESWNVRNFMNHFFRTKVYTPKKFRGDYSLGGHSPVESFRVEWVFTPKKRK